MNAFRLVALTTVLASTYVGSTLLSACSSGGDNKDGGSDSSTSDSGGKKDSGGVKDTGPTDDSGDDGAAAPILDPLCTAPVDAATNGSCVTIDGTNFACNPVNNAGCDAGGGETCDLSSNGFVCFGPPNDVALCGNCDNSNGPFCKPTMHCVGTDAGSGCARFCCDDTDCTGGHCDTTSILGQAPGVCVK